MIRDFVPPPLSELLTRYLQQQTSAHEEGTGLADATGEVVPHEAVPVQPLDPRLAWEEAQTAVRCFVPGADRESWKAPPDWSNLVASHESETALPLCLGNFPQLVRDLASLLQTTGPESVRRTTGRPAAVPALLAWAEQATQKPQCPQLLLAAAALRLAGCLERAQELLASRTIQVPAEWQPAWANEEAALAWHLGKLEEAAARWQAQSESAPVLFNRGMAALFLGRPADARPALARAAQQLPENSAWHHLARLYLALAEMRG